MQTEQKQSNGLMWFTTDLRIHDNALLSELIKNHFGFVAVYCFDPKHYELSEFNFKKTEIFRAQFLRETVIQLKESLSKIGIELLVFAKEPSEIIPELVKEFSIESLYVQEHWTSQEMATFESVAQKIPNAVRIKKDYTQFLIHPEDIPFPIENLPFVFTEFRKKVEQQMAVRPVSEIPNKINSLKIENKTEIPRLTDLGFSEDSVSIHPNSAFPFQGGEQNALERLQDYVFRTQKIAVYKNTRNGLVGKNYSSKFSAWLANGSLSAKMIYWTIKDFEKNITKNESTYWLVFELLWRDYFKYLSIKFNRKLFHLQGITQRNYSWKSDQKRIESWINGTTSDAFVNANMLELKKTGWMSNRGRQNVASYFSKELLLDWRIGAAYFESLLIDYDVHSNYANWQYVSGVGNDPRDRKFNTQWQAEKYDANHQFRKLWLQTQLWE